jgi:hypothetical protein
VEGADRWFTHICRTDDLIVHSSGEMTNPLPLEDLLCGEIPGCKPCVVGQRRPYPVLLIERTDSASTTAFRTLVIRALSIVNDSSPSFSRLRKDRLLVLTPGTLPTSAKGNVMRHKAEEMFHRDMDKMDALLSSPAMDVVDRIGFEEEGEDVPDSMSATKKSNETQSERDVAIAHVMGKFSLSLFL